MVAVAGALLRTGAFAHLQGTLRLVATPAEEYVDLDWRLEQVAAGGIEFLSGKQELVKLGVFDDVDMALMAHATGGPENRRLSTHDGSNGFVAKRARFVGRAAHAAEGPHLGINALNAATLAMSAVHFQRETFRDHDRVRIHGIITSGGEAPNIVPDDVRAEFFVRAATQEALDDAEAKVDRSLSSGARALGAGVVIDTYPGYLPLVQSPLLVDLFTENSVGLVGPEGFARLGPTAVSTDAGDLSHLLPVVHGFHGGFAGENHQADFRVSDPVDAFATPAIALAWTIIDLLADQAAAAHRVIDEFEPLLTPSAYLERLRSVGGSSREPME
jgi:amidohydrolase